MAKAKYCPECHRGEGQHYAHCSVVVQPRVRLASWAARISVEAGRLHREVVQIQLEASRYGAPPSVIELLMAARKALACAETDALTLYPQTTVTEGEDE